MKRQPCSLALPLEELAAFSLRELDEARASEIEEHSFECAECTRVLDALDAIGAGVAQLVERGQIAAGASVALVERARSAGLRLGEYRLEPGQSAQCTMRPEHDFNVLRLAATFAGVQRADVDFRVVEGQGLNERLEDVAIDRESGEIVLLFPGDLLRSLGKHSVAIDLHARSSSGDRVHASYALHHTPWA